MAAVTIVKVAKIKYNDNIGTGINSQQLTNLTI